MSDSLQPIKVKESKDHLSVLYGGVSLVKISKKVLKTFLADLGPDTKVSVTKEKVKKKRKPKVKVAGDEERKTQAKQFIRAYTERKRKFFHSKAVNGVSENSSDFKHFLAAVVIIKRHEVTYKKYLEAQIAGLSFVNNGQGTFPKPPHLSSEAAETRLLEYLREHEGKGQKSIPTVTITREERETGLLYNSKYLKANDNVKAGDATLEETVYVKEMQLVRKGKVRKYVEEYLERFT